MHDYVFDNVRDREYEQESKFFHKVQALKKELESMSQVVNLPPPGGFDGGYAGFPS